jgi:GNAT superfamily N-acetyltransferase
MTESQYELNIRIAGLKDVGKLAKIYINLPFSLREMFHPFPYDKLRLITILTVIMISNVCVPLLVRVSPLRLSTLLIAEDNKSSQILGFAFFIITGKEDNFLIANAGLMTVQGLQRTGIGSSMFRQLHEKAKKIGVRKFSVTVLEKNTHSQAFLEAFGYSKKGYTNDEYWNGKHFRNLVMEMIV